MSSRVSPSIGSSRLTLLFTNAEPAAESRIVHDDGLRALGAGGDEAYFDADLFGQKIDIAASVGGKGIHLRHSKCRTAPARQRCVDRLDAPQVLRNCRQRFT